ncbi:AzlC family ABC transporter permease [Helicobacter ailurogastricus]|uniref:AzlC family ABC transporter permease n=1 Tax=Helicobacter ailurogastricus TaxID=1578720 RepID=UPI0022C46D8B|nr:AzlC family ABC transporter permease [Helicobacter ailurogastricus]GLH58184.1 Branched-chain amino acid transport protein AzlC [Helicobacter ailurogastricus]GLH59090.1 Branched-chain amino acid transport protein AzlC [Helicobacter ailurogastricus]
MFKAIVEAFPHTIPLLVGYVLIGATFGVLVQQEGHSVWFALYMSVFIYAGAVQFLVVGLLAAHVSLLNVFLLVVLLNVRQICYAVSMLEPFSGMGKRVFYMAHTLSDETFMLLNFVKPKESAPQDFMLAIACLHHIYWVLGTALGVVLANQFSLNIQGISFIIVGVFVVIFVEQWRSTNRHAPALVGLLSAAGCLALFGKTYFLLPTLAIMVVVFILFKRRLE